jgi:hypothetical protein
MRHKLKKLIYYLANVLDTKENKKIYPAAVKDSPSAGG